MIVGKRFCSRVPRSLRGPASPAEGSADLPCVLHSEMRCRRTVDFIRCLEHSRSIDSPIEHLARLNRLNREVCLSSATRGAADGGAALDELRSRLIMEQINLATQGQVGPPSRPNDVRFCKPSSPSGGLDIDILRGVHG